ncbi:cytochrome c biogenesis protein CcsA [Aquabacterium sp.]|uniref:cytochrome C assembly family protein n=1 Tax=Aquabacterium TaxID=92793 RepID=UPI001D278123|nr:cytochrome c biogenesis protein CcsA [Aquabacterium sp.]MBT9610023.1 cytochrome c biogenesis protein CcsA [Aquabacterium sp.]|tara:strand:- start:54 stop:899 length:846 start_codon:yes stop_codon:yes gene_type:complete
MILSPTFWPSGVAVAAYALATLWPARSADTGNVDQAVRGALLLGWLAQGVAIALDVLSLDSPLPGARFGFAPALSVTAWLVLAVYAIESRRLGLPGLRRSLALLCIGAVVLAWRFPGQAYANAGSAWAPLHWLTGFASYGLIGAALLHAALLQHAERRLRAGSGTASGQIPSGVRPKGQALGMPLLRLESLTLRFVGAGFAMLSLTLLLGVAFAPWRWDHKTVFSVLSWGVFATLLVGRARFGWRGQQAIRWLVAGSTLLLLAYVGSRFVLEVILHRPVVA